MNINHLWYFINAAQTRSIRKAAQYCNTSPSTITSALKELSDTLIVPLYTKTPYGISLTEEGCLFYATAQKVISELHQCNYYFKCDAFHFDGSLHFAAIPGVMSYIMPPVFNTLLSRWPNFDATFHTYNFDAVLEQINTQNEDIGYINLSEDEFDFYKEIYPSLVFEKFVSCEPVYLTSNTHPLAKKVTVSTEEVSAYPIIIYVHNEITDNPFIKQSNYKNVQFTHNENYNAEMIKDADYLTVVPYLNGKLPNDFFDINANIVLFPQNNFVYYTTCVYHQNSSKLDLIKNYLTFSKQFY